MPSYASIKATSAVIEHASHGQCSLLAGRGRVHHVASSSRLRRKQTQRRGVQGYNSSGRKLTADNKNNKPTRPQTDRDLINTSSLFDTLAAHREANEKGTIKLSRNYGISPDDATSTWSSKPVASRSIFRQRGTGLRDVKSSAGSTYSGPSATLVLRPDGRSGKLERESDGLRRLTRHKRRPSGASTPEFSGQNRSKERDDYRAEVQLLDADWQMTGVIARYLRMPWMRAVDSKPEHHVHSSTRLAAEIMAVDRHYGPSPQEANTAKEVFNEMVELLLKACGTKYLQDIHLIGSRAAGHALCTADMDMNLVLKIPSDDKKFQSHSDKVLHYVYNQLLTLKPFGVLAHVHSARVPIILGYHRETGLAWQIQCSENCYGSLGAMKAYMAEFPAMRPLFRVLQHMLRIRGLVPHHVGARGISSYPLLTMIAVSLKIHARTTNRDNVAEQLLNFLKFWSEFDTYSQGITHIPNPHFGLSKEDLMRDEVSAIECISRITQDPVGAVPLIFDPRTSIPPFHKKHSNGDYHLVLYEPANPFNDVGHRLAPIKHAQVTFREIYGQIVNNMAEWDKKRLEEPETPLNLSLLAPALEADHTLWNLERKRLTRNGLDGLLNTLTASPFGY